MPGLDLDAIKARCAAATKPPWRIPTDDTINGRAWRVGPICGYDGDALDLEPDDPDLLFVAHAREDVPALVTEVERLRAALRHYADDANWSHGEWMGPGSRGELACRVLGLPVRYGMIEPARLKRLLGEAPPLLPWETPHPERNTADDPRLHLSTSLRGGYDC